MLLVLFITLVAASLVAGRVFAERTTAHPVALRLRTLLPSYRFFERDEGGPVPFFRRFHGAEPLEDFRRLPTPALYGWRFAFNPEGNLDLYRQTLLEALVSDLAERGPTTPDELLTMPAFTRYADELRAWLRRTPLDDAGWDVFELQVRAYDAGGVEAELLFTTPQLPLHTLTTSHALSTSHALNTQAASAPGAAVD